MARWWLVFLELTGVWVGCRGLTNSSDPGQSLDNAIQVMTSQCRGVYSPSCMQLEFLSQLEHVRVVMTSQCRGVYSPSCMKLEFLSQLEHVLVTNDYELLPGVILSRGNVTSPPLPPGLADSRTASTDPDSAAEELAPLVAERLLRQLGTWSLSVQVFGNSTLQQLRRMLHLYLNDGRAVQQGRKAKFWKYMAPAMLTLAFSILSALISKSLTMSFIALVLTVVGGRGNFGFGSPPASAPVPAVAYRSPPPLRSNEVQYVDEMPEDGAQPYVYVNRKAWKT